jgi:hypothetical protein
MFPVFAQFSLGLPLPERHAQVLHDIIKYGIAIAVISGVFQILNALLFEQKRAERKKYYNEDYLQSEAWKRKRHEVLKRDKGRCVFCGAKATDVHHTRYARRIGNEPIDWLVSICPRCHASKHPEKKPHT